MAQQIYLYTILHHYWHRLNHAILLLLAISFTHYASAVSLLNVSYDPTRELYKAYNQAFVQYWQSQTGETLTIKNSHSGSSKQARFVINGLQADVVTLALSGDIDALNRYQSLISANWQTRLPNKSTPYTSTIVFVVRKGNPKQIHDWGDLIKEDIEVITANPKTSGGARWNFLAAWAYAKTTLGDDTQAFAFMTELYRHVPVLDTGSRGATITFVQREVGDVLLAWENEAYLALNESGGDSLEIITPSISIKTEPSVAIVDKVVDEKGTRKQAQAYLAYLYSEKAQHIIAQNYYRPSNPQVLNQYQQQFPTLKLITIEEMFGNWQTVQKHFFDDNAIFDNIFIQINQ